VWLFGSTILIWHIWKGFWNARTREDAQADGIAVMNGNVSDQRKFSGNRVLAECEMIVKKMDPFSVYDNVKKGHIVLNIRGGCLYLSEYFSEQNIGKIFSDGETAMIEKLTLSINDEPRMIIENIKISFVRLRKEENREGIVFRFNDLSDQHLDMLEKLKGTLPAIGSDEEASVPFEEIITLDRGHDFELL
jgi:hypothetical protein